MPSQTPTGRLVVRALTRWWTVAPVVAIAAVTVLLHVGIIYSAAGVALFVLASLLQTRVELGAPRTPLPDHLRELVAQAEHEAAGILSAIDTSDAKYHSTHTTVELLINNLRAIAEATGELETFIQRNADMGEDVLSTVARRKSELEAQMQAIVTSVCDAHGRMLVADTYEVVSPWLSEHMIEIQHRSQALLAGTIEVEQLARDAVVGSPVTGSHPM